MRKVQAVAAPARRCRMCGCHELAACETERGPCHWVDADLCSACAHHRAAELVDQLEGLPAAARTRSPAMQELVRIAAGLAHGSPLPPV